MVRMGLCNSHYHKNNSIFSCPGHLLITALAYGLPWFNMFILLLSLLLLLLLLIVIFI